VVQAQRRLACTCNRLKWNEGARRDAHVPLKKVAFETVFSNILRTVASCGLLQLAAACIRVLLYGEGWGRAKSIQVNVTRHTSYVTRHASHASFTVTFIAHPQRAHIQCLTAALVQTGCR